MPTYDHDHSIHHRGEPTAAAILARAAKRPAIVVALIGCVFLARSVPVPGVIGQGLILFSLAGSVIALPVVMVRRSGRRHAPVPAPVPTQRAIEAAPAAPLAICAPLPAPEVDLQGLLAGTGVRVADPGPAARPQLQVRLTGQRYGAAS